MKELTLKKTVSRTYSLKDGGFYKVQFEVERVYDEHESDNVDINLHYRAMGELLDKQLKEEKDKLGL